MALEQLAAFFGWMTVLNAIFLGLAWLFVWLGRPWITALVRYFIPVDTAIADQEYLRWLMRYELFIYVFNLMPWLALKIIEAQ